MNYPIYDKTDQHLSSNEGDQFIAEFSEFVNQLINSDVLDNHVEKVIIAYVDTNGTNNLNEKQAGVLGKLVDQYSHEECKVCGEKIPLNEVLHFLAFNDGYCNFHKNKMDNDN